MTLAAKLTGLWARRPAPVADPPDAQRRSTSRTHVGLVRAINEDRVLDRPEAGLWAVIDGMGGHDAGDVAADTALRALDALATRGAPTCAEVEAALATVNETLYEAGRATGLIRGATAIVLLRDGARYRISWVGDCRAYRQHGEALAQLTRDHSVVQELIDAGQLSAEQALRHPRGNVVTRALGAAPTITVETISFAPAPGDLVLLCSDGLTRALSGRPSLAWRPKLDDIADDLIASALASDGRDNISLVLIAGA